MSEAAFTADDFAARVMRLGPARPDAGHGDHALNPGVRDEILNRPLKAAAVLIGVVNRPDGASVILTRRTEALRSHSGQVAFPGGRVDETDGTAENAALREAEEEIGLERAHVAIIGRMPDYVTGSGYRIAPVLGLVQPDHALRINPDEVDEAFEVPLGFLMTEQNYVRSSRIWGGHERHFWTVPCGRHHIWGVTAGIIRTVYEGLYA